MNNVLKERALALPLECGVYIFKDNRGKTLYVGKAKSLRRRVLSYFRDNCDLKSNRLVQEARNLEFIVCQSSQQALLLEASLIKEKKPRYNISLRDDKSYPFVVVSKEKFPRIFICRPKVLPQGIIFGPYTDAGALGLALKLIRKIFPFRSCKNMPKRECLFAHLKMCLAPCVGKISFEKYRVLINEVKNILSGRRRKLLGDLKKRMLKASQSRAFEVAAQLRDKISAVDGLYQGCLPQHSLIELKEALGLKTIPLYIEAIDIAVLSGSAATGAVVVFKDAVADKKSYRQYRIKDISGIDDYAMITQVARRRWIRLKAQKLSMPDLVLIDGGLGHVEAAKKVLISLGLDFALVGLAKENEELWLPGKNKPIILSRDSAGLRLLQRLRDEAHRFCRRYHFVLRRKKMFSRA